MGTNQTKRKHYKLILNAVNDYKGQFSIERSIYKSNTKYKDFPKKLKSIADALRNYLDTSSSQTRGTLRRKGYREMEDLRPSRCLREVHRNGKNQRNQGIDAFLFYPRAGG